MEKLFKLSAHKTNVRTEVLAGVTTFLTMAYILIVNPLILSDAGMDFGAVFTATALSSAIATLVMAFWANLPFALAPGMGLNAFFAYTVVIGMGYSWQTALTAILIEGIIFIILSAFNIREAIVNSIPENVKKAISVGIGLFIAFIGLQNAGIIVGGATLVELGNIKQGDALLALIGIVITGALVAYKVKGALLIGIVATALIGWPMGITKYAGGSYLPPSLAPTFFKFDFKNILTVDMLVIIFTFLFVDMFDTVGTLIGCCTKANMLNSDGSIPNCKEALLADAIGTTVGAILGTSTVTTYVESSAGVAEGGRSGLTAAVVGVLFLISLFLAPLFLSIPGAATAPALVLVGLFMISPVKEIDFEDGSEAIPAFLTILFMVTTYSIANGIMFGALAWILLKLLTGKVKQIKPMMIVVALLLLIKLLFT